MADISSIILPGGGTYDLKDKNAIHTSDKGVVNGVASLDSTGKVPSSQLPPISSVDPETIAPVEETATATVVHPLGSIFYLNDILYRAIADIPVGGTINTATGGNATQTTIAQNFKRTVTLTSAEYAQLSIAEKTADIVYIITDDNSIRANDINYDHETSGASATNMQDALDEAFSDVQTRVPNYGKGQNIFRNWYFVGGGTGRGVFPVNQRGQSSYSGATSVFDGWTADANTSITFGSAGITVSPLSGSSANIYQRAGKAPLGQSITMSILTGNGLVAVSGVMPSTLPSDNQLVLTVGTSADGYRLRLYLQPAGTMYVKFHVYTTQIWVAAKLELGTEQTLAHQENGVWVLNDVPDYEYELYRCITSTADPSDTYANKSLATEQQLAYVETGTTASRNYSAGQYISLNGLLYTANQAISSGTTLSVATNGNLTECVGGGFNSLSNVANANVTFSNNVTGYTYQNEYHLSKSGNVVTTYINMSTGSIAGMGTLLCTVPAAFRPSANRRIAAWLTYNGESRVDTVFISPSGEISTASGGYNVTGWIRVFGTYIL